MVCRKNKTKKCNIQIQEINFTWVLFGKDLQTNFNSECKTCKTQLKCNINWIFTFNENYGNVSWKSLKMCSLRSRISLIFQKRKCVKIRLDTFKHKLYYIYTLNRNCRCGIKIKPNTSKIYRKFKWEFQEFRIGFHSAASPE